MQPLFRYLKDDGYFILFSIPTQARLIYFVILLFKKLLMITEVPVFFAVNHSNSDLQRFE